MYERLPLSSPSKSSIIRRLGLFYPWKGCIFIIADKNTVESFGDCHCVWGYASVQAPELHWNPAGWAHWANGMALDSSVSWAFEFLLVCRLQHSLLYQRFTTLRLHNSPITKRCSNAVRHCCTLTSVTKWRSWIHLDFWSPTGIAEGAIPSGSCWRVP